MSRDGTQQAPEYLNSLRADLTAAHEAGDLWRAMQTARELLQQDPGPRIFRLLRKFAESWPTSDSRLVPLNVALLSSFSIEFTQDALAAFAFASGLGIKLYQPGYGQFRQEILNPASGLYRFAPDVVILALEGEDWCPKAYANFVSTPETDRASTVTEIGISLRSLLAAFRKGCAASVLVHNLAQPEFPGMGTIDWSSDFSQRSLIGRLNEAVAEACREAPSVYAVDYAGLVNRFGSRVWYDRRMSLFARAPISSQALAPLAREWVKYLRGIRGMNKKCLVLDLDNTLWGGVIGEDGLAGIRLGPNYPGNAFVDFQRAVLDLRLRGTIIAVASKNNPQDVDEAFGKHESMVLRREHFSAWQVHWNPKPESLREIASTLNIGLDHIVFADDNPAECDLVRLALPMVTVIRLPSEPERYVEALLDDGWFDALALSSEDSRRADLYRQRDQAESIKTEYGSVEEYLRDLQMDIVVAPVNTGSLARAAQLTQKTNQFNATTQRYSEADMLARLSDPSWLAATFTVKDRFGDNGIVGLVMAQLRAESMYIDTFLLSCRVIGRSVETAMLAWLCDRAVELGADALVGAIIPTAKNAPVRGVFLSHGFKKLTEDDSAASSWRLELRGGTVRRPDWFRVECRAVQSGSKP